MTTIPRTSMRPLPDRVLRMANLGSLLVEESTRRPNVSKHAEGVAKLAGELAADVGIAGPDLDDLRLATRIHDVGKLGIPDRIVFKVGMLDTAEFATMRTHAREGAVKLRERGLPALFVDVARFHHERYDGLGYEGLHGEAIPYAARIVHIADIYDAMREKREYKAAMPHGEILLTMTAVPGEQGPGRKAHDPVLLRRFVALRLADPATDLTPSERDTLEGFVRSDPNADLGAGSERIFAADEGTRAGNPDPRAAAMSAGPDLHADIDREIGTMAPEAVVEDEDEDVATFGM